MAEKKYVQLISQIKKWTGEDGGDPYAWMDTLTNTSDLNLREGIMFPDVTFYKLTGTEYVPKAYRIFKSPDETWMFEWEDEAALPLARALVDTIYVDKGLSYEDFQIPSQVTRGAAEEASSGGRRRRRTRKTRKGRKSRRCRTKRRRSRR